MHCGDYGERESLQFLCPGDGFACDRTESIYRIREGGRNREGSRRDRALDYRDCAREEAAQ